MANKMQGVDNIKFDDAYVDGQKVNLALGKDTRPAKVKYAFFFQTILPLLVALVSLFAAFNFRTFSVHFMFIAFFAVIIWRKKRENYIRKQKGLFDKPKYLDYTKAASEQDYGPKENDDRIKKLAPNVGDGVFFFGHELFTEQEIHAADSKVRTHIIIFGTTGSGKTENILSICVNFLTQASGFILVDGKGDTLLFAKTFSLCRAYGRTDDLYLLNFMEPEDDTKKVERNTHKFNFFVDSSSAEANEIVGGLLPNDSNGGSGMWEGRAATGIQSLNKALYYLKDQGYLEIDPDTYRSYFSLDEFVQLAMNEDIPKPFRAGLHTVLNSINYKVPTDADPNPKQNPATEEQFQYITMQYTETFNMLAEQYSHITVSQVPDISITDVVLRRRILLVLLPSLAKSEQSVRNLGRIIIAMTRNVSSKAIGNKVEGNIESTIESKPTAAISSYGLIFDEFGTYATKGASTLPAQVRSLNMVCIFAGQDYEAFKKGDEIEAATIFANCTIKICMKLEDPLTYEKFKDSAGERYVMVQESYENKDTMFGRKHIPAESSRVEKRAVIDLTDLKGQGPGEETLIYGSTTYRIKAFYADPKLSKKARLNHFLEIARPKHPTTQAMRNGVDGVYRVLKKRLEGDWESKEESAHRTITTFSSFNDDVSDVFDRVENQDREGAAPSETEMAIFALSVFVKKIELVDYNISKVLNQGLGYEFDDEYDDADLLGGEDADIEGFTGESSSGMQSLDPDINVDGNVDILTPKSEKESDARKDAHSDIDESLFDKIEKRINEKKQRLKEAEASSFNTLEALEMSVFDTQRSVQKLEEVLLVKEGYTRRESIRLSELTASNLVVEMGLQTNPAAISEKERKIKSPTRSSKEVKDMVSRLAIKGGA
jgi:intracellular multiplication protein IcmO